MEKQPAALFFSCSELYWEAARFAPLLPYLKLKKYKKRKDIKYIIYTRKERFDLWGLADVLIPLEIPGDYVTMFPNCFRLDGLSGKEYMRYVNNFRDEYAKRFNILNCYYPLVDKQHYTQRHQFKPSEMIYKYFPRKDNYTLIDKHIPQDKPIVLLAPRYRGEGQNAPKGILRRNWPHWVSLYDGITNDKFLMENFNFVLCGKSDEYIGDPAGRFYDMTKIKQMENSSLIGNLLVLLEKSICCAGSQSSIPNLSLLYGVEALEWGHQNFLHTKTYNIRNTPVTFLDDPKYDLPPKIILKNLKNILAKKLKGK